MRAAEPSDYPEIKILLNKAFKQSTIEWKIVDYTSKYDPNFQRKDLRVAEENGAIVSVTMLIRRRMRIGTAIVNGSIVGPVATHPEHQSKGYCSAVMRDTVEYMKSQDLDISLLWGIPWLYPHYGYSSSMSKTYAVISAEHHKSSEDDSCKFKPLEESNLREITNIYHENTSTRTCVEIRSPEAWEWKPGGSSVEFQVLTDRRGNVIGYCVFGTDWDGKACTHEIGVLNDESCSPVFNHILKTSKQRGLKELYCIITPDHPFARFAYWRGVDIRISWSGGSGMARVINLLSLLTKIKGELERRIRRSEIHNIESRLKITSDEGSVVLEISRGNIAVNGDDVKADYELEIPLLSLNPLITGFKGANELVKEPLVKVKGGRRALRLTEVLFPTGYPFGAWIPLFWE